MNLENIQIRKASLEDAEEVARFGRTVFVETYYDHFKNDFTLEALDIYLAAAYKTSDLTRELAIANSQYFLAFLGPTLVGYLKISYHSTLRPGLPHPCLSIDRLYLDSTVRGKGLGKTCMRLAEDAAASAEHKTVIVTCFEGNQRALNFYLSLGYKIIGTEPFFITETEFSDIDLVLSKSIR